MTAELPLKFKAFEAKQPLADKLRPAAWDQVQGLEAVDQNLVRQLKAGQGTAPSLIFWGPPGSGKTTLAKLIGQSFKCRFEQFSAVLGGVKEVREIVARAKQSEQRTILFVDEIHRFNKAQQDAFLPHVENGTIILIGATTENPSFYLTGALLSRARVVPLRALTLEELGVIARRACEDLELALSAEAGKVFGELAGGDARKLINSLEAFKAARKDKAGEVSEQEVLDYLKRARTLFYDRSGEEHYNMVSAFIKSMRGSNPDAALYWALRMVSSGEDPRFIARRMMIFASEDIGNADPRALPLAVATAEAVEKVGLPECRIPLSHCITYLASAPKSNRAYVAMEKALSCIERHPKVDVPIHLRNAPTRLMRDLGYGAEYDYPHDHEAGYVPGVQYLPDQVAGETFYQPSSHGFEKNIKERLEYLKQLKKP